MSITSYKTKNGKKYLVRWYEGTKADGSPEQHSKGGFDTLKEAKIFDSRRSLNIIEPVKEVKKQTITFANSTGLGTNPISIR